MPDYRTELLGILARLDQFETLANDILARPCYPDVGALAEELRELLADMRAKVEEKLEASGSQ
jgi:hypothetical protein